MASCIASWCRTTAPLCLPDTRDNALHQNAVKWFTCTSVPGRIQKEGEPSAVRHLLIRQVSNQHESSALWNFNQLYWTPVERAHALRCGRALSTQRCTKIRSIPRSSCSISSKSHKSEIKICEGAQSLTVKLTQTRDRASMHCQVKTESNKLFRTN